MLWKLFPSSAGIKRVDGIVSQIIEEGVQSGDSEKETSAGSVGLTIAEICLGVFEHTVNRA